VLFQWFEVLRIDGAFGVSEFSRAKITRLFSRWVSVATAQRVRWRSGIVSIASSSTGKRSSAIKVTRGRPRPKLYQELRTCSCIRIPSEAPKGPRLTTQPLHATISYRRSQHNPTAGTLRPDSLPISTPTPCEIPRPLAHDYPESTRSQPSIS